MFDKNVLTLTGRSLPVGSFHNPSSLSINSFLGSRSGFHCFIADGNNSLMTGIDIEILVEILKSAVSCLWIEEVDKSLRPRSGVSLIKLGPLYTRDENL